MGLRARLVLIVTLGLGVSLVASLGVLGRVEERVQARDAADRAAAMLATLSVPVSLMLTQGRVADVDSLMSELAARRAVLDLDDIVLVDHDGRVLASTAPDRAGVALAAADAFVARAIAAPRALQDPPPPERPRRVAVPVQTGIRWATVVGTLSEDALAARLADRRSRLVASAVVVSALGLVALLLLLSVEVLEPLRQVVRVAQRMAAGDLSARAPVRGGTELMVLAHALNDAARRLLGQKQELEAAVAARTEELVAANAELAETATRLERLAVTDPLTGLFNRRYLDQALAFEVTRQKRGRRPFSTAMIDVDSFKHYNDAHGHPAGDEVLVQLARVLQDNVRASDVVARVGGEELVVVFLDVDAEGAMRAAEKLRAAVAAHPFPRGSTQPLGHVSISVGVAAWPRDGETAEDVLAAADRALYASKARGRDRVTLATAAAREGP